MYLLYKDHKAERASRPVVTGCNSNTRGMSNCVSDLLESVNKANQDPYEVVSGEDMLAQIENYNIQAAEIIKEGRDKLCKKMECKNNCHQRDGSSPVKGEQTGHYLDRAVKGLARCDRL